MIKLAGCMIVGKCAESLKRCIESFGDLFDELNIVCTRNDPDTLQVVKLHTDRYVERFDLIEEEIDEMRSFAVARQVSTDMVSDDMDGWMWVDSDDTIINPERLKEEATVLFEEHDADMIYMTYDYEKDEDGNTLTDQVRERIFKKGYWQWHEVLHEVCQPFAEGKHATIEKDIAYINHHKIRNVDDKGSSIRNAKILKWWADKGKLSTRLKRYYGMALQDLGHYEKALDWYLEYLDESNWDKERYDVMERVFSLYHSAGNVEHAKIWASKMSHLAPDKGRPFLALAQIAAHEDRWKCVLEWLDIYEIKAKSDKTLARNPLVDKSLPAYLYQQAYTIRSRISHRIHETIRDSISRRRSAESRNYT